MEPETQELRAAILGIEPEELLDPEIRKARLGGYAEEDVDDLLERCRLQITADEREIRQLRETVTTLQQQPHGAHASALGPTTALRVLDTAQKNADRLVAEARKEAEQLRAEARKEAASLVEQGRAEAGEKARVLVTEAEEKARALVASATSEADGIRAAAPRDAERRVARYLALAATIQTQLGALLGTWHAQGEQAAQEDPLPGEEASQQNGQAKRQRKSATGAQDGT
jgi:cell division septum initiation protein DivIVA